MAQSLKLISERYFELTLDILSKASHYNKNFLSNLIKKTDLTFTEHLNNKRLDKALHLIQSSSLTLSQVFRVTNVEF